MSRPDMSAPWLVRLLLPKLRARGRMKMVRVVMSMGADTEANIWGPGGALERGHRASLERLAELGDTLGGVGAFSIHDAAQRVVGQAVSMTKEECQWALT